MCETVARGAWTYEGSQVDSAVIAENDVALAFIRDDRLDGYSYVIPKRHAAVLMDLRADEAAGVMDLLHDLSRALDAELSPDGLNVFQNNGLIANQTVPHVHFHLAPRTREQMATWDGTSDRWSGRLQPVERRRALARRLGHRLERASSRE